MRVGRDEVTTRHERFAWEDPGEGMASGTLLTWQRHALRNLHRVHGRSSADLAVLADEERVLLLEELHAALLVEEAAEAAW